MRWMVLGGFALIAVAAAALAQPVMGVMGPGTALTPCTPGQLSFNVACNAVFYSIGVN